MPAKLLEFHLSDNEQVVRTYECTQLKKWFSPLTIGFLTVTNKRVIYHSQGISFGGTSSIVSEIPIQDISGIGITIGESINWLLFALFTFVIYYTTMLTLEILPEFFTSWGFSLILMFPYTIIWLFQKQILNQDIQVRVLRNIADIPGGENLLNQNPDLFKSLSRILFFIGSAFLSWHIVWYLMYSLNTGGIILTRLLLAGVYFLIFRATMGKSREFSLRIHSKSSDKSGIVIPGSPQALLFGGNSAALQTLNAAPGVHANQIVQELGAIVTDINLMGDLGVQKWSSGS